MTSSQFSHSLALQLEEIEVHAWSDLYAAASRAVVDRIGVSVQPFGSGCLSVVPGADVLGMNRVFGMGLRQPLAQPELASLIEQYRAAGSPRFFVQVSPYAMPGEIHTWLKAGGFTLYNSWMKLYRSVENLPPAKSDLSIREISEPGPFGSIVAASFEWPEDVAPWIAGTVGRPGWRHYMAFDGDRPVATAAYFARGEFAWLDLASTLPEARGRGAQSALLYRRSADAAAQGCRWLTVETAEEKPEKPAPSFRNMVRAGFRVAYGRPNYLYQFGPSGTPVGRTGAASEDGR